MIIFNESIDLIVDEGYDKETSYIDDQTVFKAKVGTPIDAKIIQEYDIKGDMFADIQFPDGGIAFGVNRDSFIVVP